MEYRELPSNVYRNK